MYRITWLYRTPKGLRLATLTTPSALVAVTLAIALKVSPTAIAPRLWTRNAALIPC